MIDVSAHGFEVVGRAPGREKMDKKDVVFETLKKRDLSPHELKPDHNQAWSIGFKIRGQLYSIAEIKDDDRYFVISSDEAYEAYCEADNLGEVLRCLNEFVEAVIAMPDNLVVGTTHLRKIDGQAFVYRDKILGLEVEVNVDPRDPVNMPLKTTVVVDISRRRLVQKEIDSLFPTEDIYVSCLKEAFAKQAIVLEKQYANIFKKIEGFKEFSR
jgi:hypothetical protein